jgi:L-alanine-DL-glutamate epimerase-like enolase superfamily enzyme
MRDCHGLFRTDSGARANALMACAEAAMRHAVLGKFGHLGGLQRMRQTMDFARAISGREVVIHATVCKLASSLLFAEAIFTETAAHSLAVRVTATWARTGSPLNRPPPSLVASLPRGLKDVASPLSRSAKGSG